MTCIPCKPSIVAAIRERVVLGWDYRRVAAAVGVSVFTAHKYGRDVAGSRKRGRKRRAQ